MKESLSVPNCSTTARRWPPGSGKRCSSPIISGIEAPAIDGRSPTIVLLAGYFSGLAVAFVVFVAVENRDPAVWTAAVLAVAFLAACFLRAAQPRHRTATDDPEEVPRSVASPAYVAAPGDSGRPVAPASWGDAITPPAAEPGPVEATTSDDPPAGRPDRRYGHSTNLDDAEKSRAVAAPMLPTEEAGGDIAERRIGTVEPDALIAAWDDYRRRGDGHFNAAGLRRTLVQRGFNAEVGEGTAVGAGDNVLVVEPNLPDRRFYVVPNFAKSPRAVAAWFDDAGGGALTGRVTSVLKVAQGRWVDGDGGFDVVERGSVS